MASLIKTAIQDMLTALENTGQFNFVAVWNNHVERLNDGSGYSINAPAALVELENLNVARLGAGFTSTDTIVRIHIVHYELDASDGTLDQNLNVFDYRDAVKSAFTGLKVTNFSPLQYYGELQDYDHTNIYHYIIEFIGNFVDTKGSIYDADSGLTFETTPPTALDLTITYNPDPYLKGS
jgi:hypothetical protein